MKVDIKAFVNTGGRPNIIMMVSWINDIYKDKYADMKSCRCEFTIELLSTAQILVSVSDGDEDIDTEITLNNVVSIRDAVETMLDRAVWTDKRLETSNEHI
jgi:hypothetical protein